MLFLGEEYSMTIDADPSCLAGLINDHRNTTKTNPNCYFKIKSGCRTAQEFRTVAEVRALRTIRSGEELLLSYGPSFWLEMELEEDANGMGDESDPEKEEPSIEPISDTESEEVQDRKSLRLSSEIQKRQREATDDEDDEDEDEPRPKRTNVKKRVLPDEDGEDS
jgi:SET domain-containing protein